MSANKMVEIAIGELGYLEKKSNSNLYSNTANAGSNNYTKYWAEMKPEWQGQPWCDCFVSWCAKQAGESDAVSVYYYCPSHVNFFKSRNQWYARGTRTPQPGDIIFFGTSGTASHVGIVEKSDSKYVYTIEGNTSSAAGVVANGGGVFRKTYELTYSRIMGYGAPAYSAGYGWQKDSTGWWYRKQDGGYIKNACSIIDGDMYCFDERGYMMTSGKVAVCADGHTCGIESVPELRYYAAEDIKEPAYSETVNKLIEQKIISGKAERDGSVILDIGEDAIRLLVYLDRSGVFK